MIQHPIDLLPESLRARSQAGALAGRYAAALIAAVILVIVLITHARVRVDRVRERLKEAETRADLVLANETKAAVLRSRLDELNGHIEQYQRVALPLDLSRVIATLINELPPSVTLDRLDMRTDIKRTTPRGAGVIAGERPPRRLEGQVSGFALTDEDVTNFVRRLSLMAPFQAVRLDATRSRDVFGQSAREFSVSFRIDLDTPYHVAESKAGSLVHAVEEAVDGNE